MKFRFLIILIFLFNISIFNCSKPNFFRNIELQEILEENEKQKNFASEDKDACLVSKTEAYKILKEKYNLNPDYINIDDNIRFILGKCNPIVYVPGLYASRMVATINCPVLKLDFLNFVKMRLFCGNTVCKDDSNEIEEYVIFPALLDSPFQIRVNSRSNKFTACQGFFYSFYNSKDECPENNCRYSDAIRISFYGGTKETKSESQCGINSLENILYFGKLFPSVISNKLTSANFYVMVQYYRNMGYRDGFSAGGISFDYRRYIHSNKYFENSLIYQINRLYRNTGKPVIIISHSLGGLLVLANLLKMRHLLEAYLYGLRDLNTEIKIGDLYDFKVELTPFSESLYFSYAPVVAELRPQFSLIEELNKDEYSKLKLAVKELIKEEEECWDKNCPSDKVKEMTKNYYDVFGEKIILIQSNLENVLLICIIYLIVP